MIEVKYIFQFEVIEILRIPSTHFTMPQGPHSVSNQTKILQIRLPFFAHSLTPSTGETHFCSYI